MNRLESEHGLNHPEFSYRYYRAFVEYLTHNFQVIQGKDVLHGTEQDVVTKPRVFLRHDIDVSPKHALTMAKIEWSEGLKSTYHVMVRSPLYSLNDPIVQENLKEILAMGHEIGLHLDIGDNIQNSAYSLDQLEVQLEHDARILEEVVGQPIRSFSFHRQGEKIPGSHNQLIINGLVNTFSSDMGTIANGRYVADSRGVWSTNPLDMLSQYSQSKALIQLVVHPIWWGESHKTATERIQEWYKDTIQGKTPYEAHEVEVHVRNALPKFMRTVVL